MSNIWYALEDRVAVVTGGSRGIGLELARELLKQKARVAICGRKQEGLDAAVAELGGGRLLTVQAHIARQEDVHNLFDRTVQAFGRIDILINNVGMNLFTPSVVEADPAIWQKIIDSNLNGTYYCSVAAAEIMKRHGGGVIVNISSTASGRAAPGMGIYGVAKAGIESLTRVLAVELASYNIRVNAVAPSMVKTGFSKPFWSNPDMYKQIVKAIPLGTLAEPGDVVHPVLFLCSDGARFITGQTVLVDGGSASA
jgi:NAD(P)-dependent dehydrogenase (short-subunit alcohol dehydrogenase family)